MFTERIIPSSPRGLNICVRQLAGAGPPLVILHGFLEQAAAWDDVALTLHQATGRPVIVPDHRGHGRSDHCQTTTYHFWDYVSDLDGVLHSLCPDQAVDLIAHSMGGTIGTLFAACRPQQVTSLVLIEGLGPPDTQHPVQRATQFLDAMRQPPVHKALADRQDAAQRVGFLQRDLPPATAARLADRICAVRDGDLLWTWDPLHRSRTPFGFDSAKHQRFLAALTMPVMVIDGEESRLQLDDHAARVDAIDTAKRTTIAQAGHNIHHDRPQALCKVILAHLQR